MYSITDLKKDSLIQLEGIPYRVMDYQHAQLGRGGAVVKTKLKNLTSGSLLTKTFKGNDKIEPANLRKIDVQYLYGERDLATFMDTQTYDQYQIPRNEVADQIGYLAEGQIAVALIFNDRLVALELPAKVTLGVSQTEQAVRGDTTGNALKPALLETGLRLQVPLFIKAGDRVVVDSRSGKYVGRA